jgi:hypothetical protein
MHYRSAFAQRGDDLLPDEDLSIVTWCNRLLSVSFDQTFLFKRKVWFIN